jgi:hypothetical protein
MDQDMPNGDASDVGPIDLKALSLKEREALKRRITRRAHAKCARVIGAIVAWLLGRLRDVPQKLERRPAVLNPVRQCEGIDQ